jgi:photosystem II stability/assembly factor-like uncharacterized protein
MPKERRMNMTDRVCPTAGIPQTVSPAFRLATPPARRLTLTAVTGALALLMASTSAAAAPEAPLLKLAPAEQRAAAAASAMLAAARAGKRLVAVGERGTVLLSDDDGRSFRQSRGVPVATTLTGISFADEQVGWAVGHGGVVLRTDNAGETWQLQRSDLARDQPLLAVLALDAQRAVAVGLWSLALHTRDGGRSWESSPLPPSSKGSQTDLNLFGVFAGRQGELYVNAEQGRVLRSSDGGVTWNMLDTGYRGSLWAGLALKDGSLLVGGLRGTLMKSRDGGATWSTLPSAARSSITGLAQAADGRIVASALDGVVLVGRDDKPFDVRQAPDRVAFTAVVVDRNGAPVLMSRAGPRVELP